MHRQSHSVIRLPVHLYLEQNVYFKPGEEEAALTEGADQNTMLTAWFKLNSETEDSRHLLYTEIPEHYVFQKAKKSWIPRKKGANRIIPRIRSQCQRCRAILSTSSSFARTRSDKL